MAKFTMTVERTIVQHMEVTIESDSIDKAIAQAERDARAQAAAAIGPSREGWEPEINAVVIGNVSDDEGNLWY